MMVRCRNTSVHVGITAATLSMLGESKASGPDCMKEVSGTTVRYGNTHTRIEIYIYTLHMLADANLQSKYICLCV